MDALDVKAPGPVSLEQFPLEPCPLLLLRVSAASTGVPLRGYNRSPWAAAPADTLFGWAASTMPIAATIPVDLTFERLYLGFVPATALPMACIVLIALVASIPIVRRVQHILDATARDSAKER